jgi:hypothetical protein
MQNKKAFSSSLDGFDYRVKCDDFVLYELGRIIEEDRASLEDEEFRRLIREGIHEHIDTRLEIRAEMAKHLRLQGLQAARILRAVEDIESPLLDVEMVVRTYTAYLFRKLEECTETNATSEDAVARTADLLFDSLENRTVAEHELDLLGSIRTPVSARVLAHVISEPMLDEDLETKAYGVLRAMWPLPRHYILYSLKPHTHEDIPFRWFQLLIDSDELTAVDCILEEVFAHAKSPNFREDLLALVELLGQAHDPYTEDKIMQVLNNPSTPRPAVQMLETFLKTSPPRAPSAATVEPWASFTRLQFSNKEYLAAAKLFDAGRKTDALRKLDELLERDPGYPMAVMLKELT